MAVGMWRGVGNVARKIKKRYRCVNNVARTVKKRWRGVNNVARLTYQGELVLYDNGVNSGNLKISTDTSASASFGTDSISFTTATSNNNSFLTTDTVVDYDNYTTLYIDFMVTSVSSSAEYFGFKIRYAETNGSSVFFDPVEKNVRMTMEIDLTSIHESGHESLFELGADAWREGTDDDYHYAASGNIYKIWLE